MYSRGILHVVLLVAGLGSLALAGPSIPIDRKLQKIKVKPGPNLQRRMMNKAGKLMGDWSLNFSDIEVDGAYLQSLAVEAPDEPFLRVVRERFRRPIDLEDFLYFLDDVLVAGDRGRRGKLVWVPSGRARGAGILVHPQDIFRKNRPRKYGVKKKRLNIDQPTEQLGLEPAKDGDLLGPNWTTRYKNPWTQKAKLDALAEASTSGTFAQRSRWLIDQLESQKCKVALYTTVRNRHRGYLMWGAFRLKRLKTKKAVIKTVKDLVRINKRWKLNVPIRWYHPKGWRATIEAARQMNDAYGVVFATRSGARKSKHYDGEAIDITAVGLPRKLDLEAPDGARRSFDLSDPAQPRDLNLTPILIRWIEKHFQVRKLKMDYPHWDDVADRIRKPEEIPE